MKILIVRMLAFCLVVLAVEYFMGPSTAHAQKSKDGYSNFMKRNATPDDWVKALKRAPTSQNRGLTPQHEAAKMENQKEMAKNPVANVLITFEFNSAKLTSEAKHQLDGLARALRSPDLWGNKIRLEGHTDASGPEEYNNVLSQLRAEAVRDYLMQRANLDSNMFDAVGMGERNLLDKDEPFARVNRRVSIINIGS